MATPHTNRLIHETSPYLLQHAHNPVDWYPWGDEAFEKAKSENKPMRLSIGYSACHWCHVMERESFEDAETAALMNRLFVNIKVDREERPDLDHVYQLVVQLMGRSGGWPLTVFLTPDQRPFFAGTYFPPTDRHGMPGFPTVLRAVADAYRGKRADVELQARELAVAGMRKGGIWDHLGGGFHRYSTDERWLVPHFEKMLYDNALLLRLYTDAFRAFGNDDDAATASDIGTYLLREMQGNHGGFFA